MSDLLVRWLIPNSYEAADLKEALVGLASIVVVVWTGALVLRQIKNASSTWTVIGAMDLMQSSFVVSILAVGLPSAAYRGVGVLFVTLYFVAYWFQLACFCPRFLALQKESYQQSFKMKGDGTIYKWSVALFFIGAVVIIAEPTRQAVFIVAFLWFFFGSQVLYTQLHNA